MQTSQGYWKQTDLPFQSSGLQLWAGDVLHEIIRDAVENNYAVFKDKESEE